MSVKTEGDIPGLFRQFSGNSANYQELTREAAARASQARWPLLSAVELEQGDIPAVLETAVVAVEPAGAALQAPVATTPSRVGPARVVPFQSVEREAPVMPVAAAPVADAPQPIVLPGNTIFMPPAANTARHFAQLERTLAARRAAALSEIVVKPPVQAEVVAAVPQSEPPVLVHVIPPAVVTPAPPVVESPRAPAPALLPTPAPAAAPARHAGLKPIFARLAGEPEADTRPVDSLFNRLLQS